MLGAGRNNFYDDDDDHHHHRHSMLTPSDIRSTGWAWTVLTSICAISSFTSSLTGDGVGVLLVLVVEAVLSGDVFSAGGGTCLFLLELSPNCSDLFSSQSFTTLNMEVLTLGLTGLDEDVMKNIGSEVPFLDGESAMIWFDDDGKQKDDRPFSLYRDVVRDRQTCFFVCILLLNASLTLYCKAKEASYFYQRSWVLSKNLEMDGWMDKRMDRQLFFFLFLFFTWFSLLPLSSFLFLLFSLPPSVLLWQSKVAFLGLFWWSFLVGDTEQGTFQLKVTNQLL